MNGVPKGLKIYRIIFIDERAFEKGEGCSRLRKTLPHNQELKLL